MYHENQFCIMANLHSAYEFAVNSIPIIDFLFIIVLN